MTDAQITIQPHSRVRFHYQLLFPDNREIESSFGGEPMDVTLNQGAFEPRLEKALIGLPLGEQTRILLQPQYAFGQRDPNNVHNLPRDAFPADMPLTEQQVVEFDLPNGQSVAGTIEHIEGDQVRVDFNHPLAGHNVQFIVHILEIDGEKAADG